MLECDPLVATVEVAAAPLVAVVAVALVVVVCVAAIVSATHDVRVCDPIVAMVEVLAVAECEAILTHVATESHL